MHMLLWQGYKVHKLNVVVINVCISTLSKTLGISFYLGAIYIRKAGVTLVWFMKKKKNVLTTVAIG